MKEIKKSLGTFETMSKLEAFLEDDNERPYREKGYRRKFRINTIRNAFITEYNKTVWFASRGYGTEYYFSEEEKNKRFGLD